MILSFLIIALSTISIGWLVSKDLGEEKQVEIHLIFSILKLLGNVNEESNNLFIY